MLRLKPIHFLALLSLNANATTFLVPPVPEFTSEAEYIVRGTIDGSGNAEWVEEGRGRAIFTYYVLEVSQVLKGKISEGKSIRIRERGGEVDGIGMRVAGTAKFQSGEDVLVFLKGPHPDGSFGIRGLMLGKAGVRAVDGVETLHGGVFSAQKNHGHTHDSHEHDHTVKKWTLPELNRLVESQKKDSKVGRKVGTMKNKSGSESPAESGSGDSVNRAHGGNDRNDSVPHDAAESKTISKSLIDDEDGSNPIIWVTALLIGMLGLASLLTKRK